MTKKPQRHSASRARQLGLCSLVLALVCLCCGALVSNVSAQETKFQCNTGSQDVHCTLQLRELLGPQIQSRLKSGFLNRFLYRVYIRRVDNDEVTHLAAYQTTAVYELWDEVFYLSEDSEKRSTQNLNDVLDHLGHFQSLLIASQLPPGRYYADLIVEMNPLSEVDEAAIRKWIARNRGGHRTFANGERSFFGTFVSLFTNIRSGKAEWSHRIRSRPFTIKNASP